jgi:hypothetical protein
MMIHFPYFAKRNLRSSRAKAVVGCTFFLGRRSGTVDVPELNAEAEACCAQCNILVDSQQNR